MLRVVVADDGHGSAADGADARLRLRPDPSARLPGRGAWLHPSLDCFDLALRRRAFGRALRVRPGAALDADPVREHLVAFVVSGDGPDGSPGGSDT